MSTTIWAARSEPSLQVGSPQSLRSRAATVLLAAVAAFAMTFEPAFVDVVARPVAVEAGADPDGGIPLAMVCIRDGIWAHPGVCWVAAYNSASCIGVNCDSDCWYWEAGSSAEA